MPSAYSRNGKCSNANNMAEATRVHRGRIMHLGQSQTENFNHQTKIIGNCNIQDMYVMKCN